MDDVVLRVEGLGKRFRKGTSQGYSRASEVVARSAGSALRFPLRMWSSRRGGRGPSGNGERPSDTDFWALRDVNFEVQRGQIVGVIGRNGAGKSTLLKLLSRITEPSEGRFGVAGRIGSLLEVGTGFHPELTGKENVFLSGNLLGMNRGEVRSQYEAIVDFAQIGDFLDTPVKRYSSGMKVRLGFAVAAHLRPEILLVDEVLAVGDAEFRKRCLKKMGDIAGGGRTVVFVSHDMQAIGQLCDRLLLFSGGRLRKDGGVREVVDTYFQSESVGTRGAVEVDGNRDRDPRIAAVRLADGNAETKTVFEVGGPLVVSVDVESAREIENAFCQIDIIDSSGCRVMHLLNTHSQTPLRVAGRQTINCRAEDLRLLPGAYRVNVCFGELYGSRTTLDAVDSVLGFDVLLSDYLGGGRFKSQLCQFVQKTTWSIR